MDIQPTPPLSPVVNMSLLQLPGEIAAQQADLAAKLIRVNAEQSNAGDVVQMSADILDALA